MTDYVSGLLSAALNKDSVISDAFEIARQDRAGLIGLIRMAEAAQPFDGYKMNWLEMQTGAAGNTVNGAIAANVTALVLDSTAAFRAGMQISIKDSDEVMYVSAVVDGTTLTVTRGFGGTTAAAIADNAVVIIDSVAREENSGAVADDIVEPELVENFFQTFDTAITMSRRALATNTFGMANAMAFQLNERMRALVNQMDRALLRGRRAAVGTNAAQRTTTGGLTFYTDQTGGLKNDGAAAALTLAMINQLNADIVEAGGTSDTVVVGVAKARAVQALVNANYTSQRLGEWQADEGSVLTLPSDLPLIGNVNKIVVDTNCNDNELFMVDSRKLSIRPMAAGNAQDSGAWRTLDATTNGQDGETVRILGDFAFEIEGSKTSQARLHNLA